MSPTAAANNPAITTTSYKELKYAPTGHGTSNKTPTKITLEHSPSSTFTHCTPSKDRRLCEVKDPSTAKESYNSSTITFKAVMAISTKHYYDMRAVNSPNSAVTLCSVDRSTEPSNGSDDNSGTVPKVPYKPTCTTSITYSLRSKGPTP